MGEAYIVSRGIIIEEPPLGTEANPALSGTALFEYDSTLPAGLYYFKNETGQTQELFCDVPNGGWVLVASNNASSSTIPSGTGRNNLAYTLNRNGTFGHLGTASPNSDYIIGNFLDTFTFNQVRGVGFGYGSTNGSVVWPNLGTHLIITYNLNTTGTNRYTEKVPRANATIQGNSSTSSLISVFVIDAVRNDIGLNANQNQSTIGIAGTSNANGDPSNGCYYGHGTSEGSFEGWYPASGNPQNSQGYTTWVR
jgi:hypothetical protein